MIENFDKELNYFYEIKINSFVFFFQNKKNSLLLQTDIYYHLQNEKEIQKNKQLY